MTQAYKDAPYAMQNEGIYDVIEEWPNMKFEETLVDDFGKETVENTDLAHEFYIGRGLTASWLKETIFTSTVPFPLYPLKHRNSLAFWTAVKFRAKYDHARFQIDIPQAWLEKRLSGKKLEVTRFGK